MISRLVFLSLSFTFVCYHYNYFGGQLAATSELVSSCFNCFPTDVFVSPAVCLLCLLLLISIRKNVMMEVPPPGDYVYHFIDGSSLMA
jgi:hypothetical protein